MPLYVCRYDMLGDGKTEYWHCHCTPLQFNCTAVCGCMYVWMYVCSEYSTQRFRVVVKLCCFCVVVPVPVPVVIRGGGVVVRIQIEGRTIRRLEPAGDAQAAAQEVQVGEEQEVGHTEVGQDT